MRGWWQDLTDLVLPAECGGCGRPRAVLCPECRAALTGAAPSRVRPVPEPTGLPVVHAAVPYADEVRAVLLAHKERGVLPLAGPLGVTLAGAVRAGLGYVRLPVPGGALTASEGPLRGGNGQLWSEGPSGMGGGSPGRADTRSGVRAVRVDQGGWPRAQDGPSGVGAGQSWAGSGRRRPGDPAGAGRGPVLLVPVPSSRRAVRARGHDPARRIALAAAGELRRTGTRARVLAVLRQRRAVADQSGLNSQQRLANLAGALEVAVGGEQLLADGGRIVLVDDLMTTGASLTEAARAVRAAVPDESRAARGRGDGCRTGAVTGVGAGGATTYTGGTEVMICAAVVAAPPDSFEINRN